MRRKDNTFNLIKLIKLNMRETLICTTSRMRKRKRARLKKIRKRIKKRQK